MIHDLTDLSQIIIADIAALEHAISHALPQTIGMLLFVVVIGIMLLVSNWKLGLTVIIPIILSLYFNQKSLQKQKNMHHDLYDVHRKNSQAFQNAIEMQKEIRNYNLQAKTKETLDHYMEESEKQKFRTEMSQGNLIILSSMVLQFVPGLLILIGLPMVQANEVSPLYIIGYILASMRINDALFALYLNLGELMYIDAVVQRLNDLYGQKLQVGTTSTLLPKDIELDHVLFSYDNNRNVINDVSCTIKENEVVALIGPSGCGKTTLLKLISRLYDYDKGEIRIGNTPIHTVNPEALYDKLSVVFQDVVLFNTSIYNNIKLGNEASSKEEILHAARLAGCDEFVSRFEDGYDTIIGENGSKLSGGERQRISIARAFLKNAPIIILDEIASNLDVENENIIQTSLQHLIKDKTVIIISHRLKSVENCDRLLVFNEGTLVGNGTHEELLQSCNLYQSMITKTNLTEQFHY